MTHATGKPGRPSAGDKSGEMRKVSFRVDAATEAALDALESRLDRSILHGRRSALLRKLVMDAFAKLDHE